jgi:collagenase-like PrtC family protease
MEVAMPEAPAPVLTLGPILFHWPAETKRDFYFRIADEAPVDSVYIGEVICSKRTPFFEREYEKVAERLKRGGKHVIYSTLAEVMIKRDRRIVKDFCTLKDVFVEANDGSALYHFAGRPHAIGPFLNVYNEATLEFLAGKGAVHVTLPPELPASALPALGSAARQQRVTLEAQVYGRLPLALSARCYHARAHGRVKDNCGYVCEQDSDGMDLNTLVATSFLTINGIQTLSYTCLNLVHSLAEMSAAGITHFRLSPHSCDMVGVAAIFRAVLNGNMEPAAASEKLHQVGLPVPFCNGFYHKTAGYKWVHQNFKVS